MLETRPGALVVRDKFCRPATRRPSCGADRSRSGNARRVPFLVRPRDASLSRGAVTVALPQQKLAG